VCRFEFCGGPCSLAWLETEVMTNLIKFVANTTSKVINLHTGRALNNWPSSSRVSDDRLVCRAMIEYGSSQVSQ